LTSNSQLPTHLADVNLFHIFEEVFVNFLNHPEFMSHLILFNANVITLDPKKKSAQLVAIHKNRVQAVTTNSALGQLKQKTTQVIDCLGKTLLPGFCDAHMHLQASAAGLMSLDLSHRKSIRSISDIQSAIKKFSKNLAPGTWIRARGYHEFHLAEKRHPTRRDLDMAAPEHPVKLTHQSTHACVLNSKALDHAGITRYTPDPPGGLIDRDLTTGDPNGVLFEMNDYLSRRIPPLDEAELIHGVRSVNQQLLSLGITSIHEASSNNDGAQWQTLCALKEKEYVVPRVSMMLGLKGFENKGIDNLSCPVGPDQLRLGPVKIILDETSGQLYPSQSKLNQSVLAIHQRGLQVAIHAIEENAVASAGSAIAHALKKFPRADHRHRIEHCSVCPPPLANHLASLGIMVVTQPSFIYYNGQRYRHTVPQAQLPYLYPIRTLQNEGLTVAAGSDTPIVPPNPMIGIHAAVTRTSETFDVLSKKEAVTPLEALRMYTQHAAKATFEEHSKGSITPGKFADLILVNDDPTAIPPDEIKHLEVEMTIVDGRIVWKKNA
jgi:predicted amidohydrolase YtcJ